MSKKPRFRIPFDSRQGKASQTLLSFFLITLPEIVLKNLSLSDI